MNEAATKDRTMITAIEIKNFKGIGNEGVRVELKPLTLLFGPNSAGKSTIVQAIHYAREIFERHELNPDRTVLGGDTLDLGGFQNFVHNHDVNLRVHLGFDLHLAPGALPDYYDFEWVYQGGEEIGCHLDKCSSAWIETQVAWGAAHQHAEVESYRVGLEGKQAIASIIHGDPLRRFYAKLLSDVPEPERPSEKDLDRANLLLFHWNHPLFKSGESLSQLHGITLKTLDWFLEQKYCTLMDRPTVDSLPSALPEWGKALDLACTEGTDLEEAVNLISALSKMIVGPGELLRNQLREFRYLGPLRALPARNFEPRRQPDLTRWANGLAAWDELSEADDELITRVNHWLSRLKSGYSVRLKRYREVGTEVAPAEIEKFGIKTKVVLVPGSQSIEVLPHDVGVGISQLLPAVVLALSSRRKLIAIEQPELHLHPALQKELGDLFIESAQEAQNCVILETHSEHLILRLLRRVRETTEGKLPPGAQALRADQVSVIYVEQTEQGVKLSPLRIDETGDFIDRWPSGFFEEREEELF